MSRTKRGVTSRAKHKKVFKAVKGQWGRRKNTIRVAKQAMEKSMQYAYRDRRNKKRDFKEGKIITGLLYVDNECKPLTEIMDLPDKPLNSLGQEELCPGSEILKEINKGLS